MTLTKSSPRGKLEAASGAAFANERGVEIESSFLKQCPPTVSPTARERNVRNCGGQPIEFAIVHFQGNQEVGNISVVPRFAVPAFALLSVSASVTNVRKSTPTSEMFGSLLRHQ